MDQSVIDEAVKIATRSAMRGNPLDRVVWIPPQSASADPRGSFVLCQAKQYSASETPSWER
jgi:hypothetical protein